MTLNKSKLDQCFFYYYPIVMITQLLTAMGFPIPPYVWGYLFNLFWIIIGFSYLRFSKSPIKKLLILLLAYFLMSSFAYLYNGVSFYCYYRELLSFLLPFLFVFVGISNSDRRIYKIFILSVLFCDIIGFGLHFLRPSFYTAFKMSVAENLWYLEETVMDETDIIFNGIGRFSSFFPDSYPIAFYNTFALCVMLDDFCKSRDLRIIPNNNMQLVCISIILISIVLSMSRVAMVFSLLMLLYFYVLCVCAKNKNQYKFLILISSFLLIASLAIVLISRTAVGSDIIELVMGRFGQLNYDALMVGRESQYEDVLSSWQNKLMGDGLGSKGGTAAMLGYTAITDGGWTRFIVEYGYVGLLLFLIIIIKTLLRGWRNKRYLSKELMIVCYGLISMIGANTLAMAGSVIIFWFALGRIWNREHLKNNVILGDKI